MDEELADKSAFDIVSEVGATGRPTVNSRFRSLYSKDYEEGEKELIKHNLYTNNDQYVNQDLRNRNKPIRCCCCSLTHCFVTTFIVILLLWGSAVTWMAINANNTDDLIYGKIYKIAKDMAILENQIKNNTLAINEMKSNSYEEPYSLGFS